MIAYDTGSMLTLKPSNKGRIYFKGRYFNSVREITAFLENAIITEKVTSDSLEYENPPVRSLKYPIEIGSQWIYRNENNPWRIDKKVSDMEKVQVQAGIYTCYKILWLFDIDNNGEWDDDIVFFDYICSKGLIKRYISYKDLIWTGENSPEPLGTFDSSEEYLLTGVHLK